MNKLANLMIRENKNFEIFNEKNLLFWKDPEDNILKSCHTADVFHTDVHRHDSWKKKKGGGDIKKIKRKQ